MTISPLFKQVFDDAPCILPETIGHARFDVTIAANDYGLFCLPKRLRSNPVISCLNAGNVYQPRTTAMIQRDATSRDVVSVGALYGAFLPALSMAMTRTTVLHCIDPDPISYHAALQTVALNELRNISPTQAALHPAQLSPNAKARKVDDIVMSNRDVGVLHVAGPMDVERTLRGAINLLVGNAPTLVIEADEEEPILKSLLQIAPHLGYKVSSQFEGNLILTA